MKNLLNLLFLTAIMTLVSCSSGQSSKEETQVESMMDDAVALEDETEFNSMDDIREEEYTDDTIEERPEDMVVETVPQDMSEPAPMQVESMDSGQMAQYTVQKGDTLMLISFKIYGDYARWRDLANNNPQLANFQSLTEGDVLNYQVPAEQFNWQPEGNPYLIKRNDTLVSISQDLYSTHKRWRHLYEHNKPLIKDPNVIFAGFTIYYMQFDESGRELANEM